MGFLAEVLHSRNVGLRLKLLTGPNADVAARSEKLLNSIYGSLQAINIPVILRFMGWFE